MEFTRTSVISGVTRTRDIDVTPEQYALWKLNNTNIQNAFPHLSAGDREFLLSGITDEEWENAFGEEE